MRTIRVTCDWCGKKGDCDGDAGYLPKGWALLYYASFSHIESQRSLEICPKCKPVRMRQNEVSPKKV